MMTIEKYKVADVTFALDIGQLDFPDGASPFYSPFRTQSKEDIQVRFHRKTTLPKLLSKEATLFDGGENWKLFSDKKGYRLEMYDSKTFQRDRSAEISSDFTQIDVTVKKTKWDFQKLLRPLLEIVFVNYLAPKQGLLLHAASIRDHDKGYLFSGNSGNGKTTMTHLWKNKIGDYSVLGDERALVRKIDGEWFVFGTPWPGIGMIIENKTVALNHIYLIRHGKGKHKTLEAHPALLFQELFAQVFSSFWNERALEQISQTCQNLIEEVPCHQLAFLKKESVTDFIQDHAENFNLQTQ